MIPNKQHGKYGTDRHFELIKKTLIHIVERYWETYGTLSVENTKITMRAGLWAQSVGMYEFPGGEYDLHPDIAAYLRQENEKQKKAIIVECETTADNLLKDELRLTAYKLLRMRNPAKDRLMMYIAFPSELKGKVEKPECFNDLLFFDLKEAPR